MNTTFKRCLATVVTISAAAVLSACSSSDDKSPVPSISASPTIAEQPTATPSPSVAAGPTTYTINVHAGKAVGGLTSLTAKVGEQVILLVTTDDTTNTVHLHGYDIERPLAPGKVATFEFKADVSGVFEIELEDTSVKIADLTVR